VNALLPILLISGSVVVYQIGQKFLPSGMNQWYALIIYYVVAFLITVGIILFVRPSQTLLESLKSINWALILVCISIVGIEVGWILAFRSGASLSLTGLLVNAVVAVVVVPLGVVLFKERFSWETGLGLVLCLAGLALLARH
jgi:drug/metabolite transporter (DMT)-like permease